MGIQLTTITFLSLFFGLMTGPCPVEVTVNGPVVSVEILLDGKRTGSMEAPPWKTEVDFGSDLLPHELTARALDAAGRELGRAREWVNLPHPLAKVDILLEGETLAPPRMAKVAWTNLTGERPRTITLSFDDQRLPLDTEGRAALPPHDLKSVHVLSAEIRFSSQNLVRKDVSYGGEYGSAVSTELTGVPLRVRRALPPAATLRGWLTAAGIPLPVVAVEKGPAQLYVVYSADGVAKMGAKGLGAGEDHVWRAAFGRDQQVRLLGPFSRRHEASGATTDLFYITPPFDTAEGFPSLLRSFGSFAPPGVTATPGKPGPKRRIADAVAVAAQEAVWENRRRAVLLLVSGRETDESLYDAARVRPFLASLRVPLFVWCLEEPPPGSSLAGWGKCLQVSSARNLLRGMAEIREELDSQRIVMVDGLHLPQSISLSPEATGVELVGGLKP